MTFSLLPTAATTRLFSMVQSQSSASKGSFVCENTGGLVFWKSWSRYLGSSFPPAPPPPWLALVAAWTSFWSAYMFAWRSSRAAWRSSISSRRSCSMFGSGGGGGASPDPLGLLRVCLDILGLWRKIRGNLVYKGVSPYNLVNTHKQDLQNK